MFQTQVASMNEWSAAAKEIKEVARRDFVKKLMYLHSTVQSSKLKTDFCSLEKLLKKLELREYCDL